MVASTTLATKGMLAKKFYIFTMTRIVLTVDTGVPVDLSVIRRKFDFI